jgi:hypothetical protein
MPNKHFCQGPWCHTQVTQDRFLKSRGVIRGRYARINMDYDHRNSYYGMRDKYFCSQGCESNWLSANMENIEHGRPIEFIRHRRESGGYEKVTEENDWGRNYTYIKRVDNRTELD